MIMEKLRTANYFQKRIIHFLFNEKWYNKIKLYKIIWYYKFGIPYEMSPLLKKIISVDSTVLDIGANMGQYACRLNDIVRKGNGHIYSFEPVTSNFISLKSMKDRLKLKNLTINQMGVSNVVEETIINIPIFDNGLVVGTRATIQNISEIKHKTEAIKVTTIDSYVSENRIEKIDFIKCDTEGNEINVLNGGRKTITKDLPILSFEMSYKDEGLDWLLDLGYDLFYYDSQINKLRKINGYQDGNLIFVNKSQQKNLDRIIEYA
ncbi:MAG: FkbM family methyltransferase [Bacteroidales bacterium]|nr:FkbM family methyltransferase [Bacteroidales bacterium]